MQKELGGTTEGLGKTGKDLPANWRSCIWEEKLGVWNGLAGAGQHAAFRSRRDPPCRLCGDNNIECSFTPGPSFLESRAACFAQGLSLGGIAYRDLFVLFLCICFPNRVYHEPCHNAFESSKPSLSLVETIEVVWCAWTSQRTASKVQLVPDGEYYGVASSSSVQLQK